MSCTRWSEGGASGGPWGRPTPGVPAQTVFLARNRFLRIPEDSQESGIPRKILRRIYGHRPPDTVCVKNRHFKLGQGANARIRTSPGLRPGRARATPRSCLLRSMTIDKQTYKLTPFHFYIIRIPGAFVHYRPRPAYCSTSTCTRIVPYSY